MPVNSQTLYSQQATKFKEKVWTGHKVMYAKARAARASLGVDLRSDWTMIAVDKLEVRYSQCKSQ